MMRVWCITVMPIGNRVQDIFVDRVLDEAPSISACGAGSGVFHGVSLYGQDLLLMRVAVGADQRAADRLSAM